MEIKISKKKNNDFSILLVAIYKSKETIKKKIKEYDNFFNDMSLWSSRLSVTTFGVYDNQTLVCHAVVQEGKKAIYIGFVETVNSKEVVEFLIKNIKDHLNKRDNINKKIYLPVNQSIWHNYRFKVSGNELPVFDVNNPSYYSGLFKKYFKYRHLFETYESNGINYNEPKKFDYNVMEIKIDDLQKEIKKAYEVLISNFGDEHEPPSYKEFEKSIYEIKNILNPKLVQFVKYKNKNIGFISSFVLDNKYYLKNVSVLSNYRNNKIGKYLYGITSGNARHMGAKKEYYLFIRIDRLIHRIIKHKKKTIAKYVLYYSECKHF